MTETMPDGYVVHMPALPKHRQPHVFGDAVVIPAETSDSGFEQKEKACKNCGAVRVTIFSSDALRMRGWRLGAGMPLIETSVAPSCLSASQVVS